MLQHSARVDSASVDSALGIELQEHPVPPQAHSHRQGALVPAVAPIIGIAGAHQPIRNHHHPHPPPRGPGQYHEVEEHLIAQPPSIREVARELAEASAVDSAIVLVPNQLSERNLQSAIIHSNIRVFQISICFTLPECHLSKQNLYS